MLRVHHIPLPHVHHIVSIDVHVVCIHPPTLLRIDPSHAHTHVVRINSNFVPSYPSAVISFISINEGSIRNAFPNHFNYCLVSMLHTYLCTDPEHPGEVLWLRNHQVHIHPPYRSELCFFISIGYSLVRIDPKCSISYRIGKWSIRTMTDPKQSAKCISLIHAHIDRHEAIAPK